MLRVIEMHALVGWLQLTNFVIPGHPMNKQLFRTALRSHLTVAQWRQKLQTLLQYGAADAAAVLSQRL